MPSVKNLSEKTVILKIAGANAPVSTTVISEDTQGLWFSGGGLIGQLAQAGMPTGFASPIIFVPFSQIQYLIVNAG
jgi:hypothetical protein